jgi:hypothetical protein
VDLWIREDRLCSPDNGWSIYRDPPARDKAFVDLVRRIMKTPPANETKRSS